MLWFDYRCCRNVQVYSADMCNPTDVDADPNKGKNGKHGSSPSETESIDYP